VWWYVGGGQNGAVGGGGGGGKPPRPNRTGNIFRLGMGFTNGGREVGVAGCLGSEACDCCC